jgi:hypothetical protein
MRHEDLLLFLVRASLSRVGLLQNTGVLFIRRERPTTVEHCPKNTNQPPVKSVG